MKIPCGKCGKQEPAWCNRADCTLFPKTHISAKESFSGTTPNLFIGRHGYPLVNAGVLAAESYNGNDNPKRWTEQQTPISEIVRLRSTLVNSTFKASVHEPSAYEELRSLIAQSEEPVAIDVDLARKPIYTIQYPSGTTPHGPSVALKHAALTENVHVPTDVDKVLHDELKASEQIALLGKRHDEYYLQKIFAAGLLGEQKRLVPTRWSITAVDDTLGKQHLARVRTLPVASEVRVYTGGHYGNYYAILLLPEPWQYELFELYVGARPTDKRCWTDYEPYTGRTSYADDAVGGYYAARLGITRHVLREKRQAAVLAFRFVTDEYTNPLGVWVVREAVRLCMNTKPLQFSSEELALQYLRALAQKKHGTNIEPYLHGSRLFASRKQRTLGAFTA